MVVGRFWRPEVVSFQQWGEIRERELLVLSRTTAIYTLFWPMMQNRSGSYRLGGMVFREVLVVIISKATFDGFLRFPLQIWYQFSESLPCWHRGHLKDVKVWWSEVFHGSRALQRAESMDVTALSISFAALPNPRTVSGSPPLHLPIFTGESEELNFVSRIYCPSANWKRSISFYLSI